MIRKFEFMLDMLAAIMLSANIVAFYLYLPYGGWEYNASERVALTATFYGEAAVNEPEKGLRAIGWAVFNRVASEEFPDTIREVVTENFKNLNACQVSAFCDGRSDIPRDLNRWFRLYAFAGTLLEDPGQDITGGATHYWLPAIESKRWVQRDILPRSKQKIGSHRFGCSLYRGDDIPCTASQKYAGT